MNAIVSQDSLNATDQLIAYFSDWGRLKIAVAWFLKWRRILLQLKERVKELQALDDHKRDANGSSNYVSLEMEKAKVAVGSQTLSANDLLEAEVSMIRYSQQQRFKEEIVVLSAGKSVARDSVIYKLDPCLEDGLLRVVG